MVIQNENTHSIPAFSEKHGWIEAVLNCVERRTKYTKNEIRVYEDGVCEIDVYDIYGNYKNTGEFSKEDLEIVQQYKWYQDSVGYLSTTVGKNKYRMHRILFPDSRGVIDHYDNNKLNNTRENLQKIPHSVNIAKITNKMLNKSGVTGIYLTVNNTWQASIEVNGEKKCKTFKTKEEAIVWRYISEINTWGINAPQLRDIQKDYPRLAKAIDYGVHISDNVNLVISILKKLDADEHCPCSIVKNEDTKCMCREFREMDSGMCHCGLYIKE